MSPFFYGFYDLSVWGPITLVMLASLFGLVLARPPIPRGRSLIALVALAGLWLWALLSIGWAESASQAVTDANRWLLYAAVFGVVVLLVRHDRLAGLVLAAATAPIVALGIYLAGRMLVGTGEDLFVLGRLEQPLGYINGQAGYLLMGVWPLVAVAERVERPFLSGGAVAGAVLLAGLVVLTQTRAVVPAAAISALVIVGAVSGRGRRLWVLLAVTAGVLASLDSLLAVYESTGPNESPASGPLRDAAVRLLACALIAGSVWALVAKLGRGIRGSLAERPGLARAVGVAPLVILALAASGAVAAADDPTGRLEREYRAFVELQSVSGTHTTRFLSGAGNRYDYWRIALDQFGERPVRGLGAGNYDTTYYLETKTGESIKQPHSIELQALAELGSVGFLLVVLFMGAVLAGFVGRARAGRDDIGQRQLAVAAGGAFLMWAFHTSMDWLHLLPGATGMALCSGAVLTGPSAESRRVEGTAWKAAVVMCGALVVLGGVMVARATLAEHWRTQGFDVVATDPGRALEKARDALSLDDETLANYYLIAAANARLDRYEPTRAALLEATRREPRDHVPWALLGDVEVRRGNVDRAAAYYLRSSQLNPKDKSLRRLARQPPTAP